MIKVIGFDLDDTLWAVRPVIIRAEQKLNHWLKGRAPELRYEMADMAKFRERALAQDPDLIKKITELRRQVLLLALEDSAVANPETIANEAIEVFLTARNEIEFFDGALDALQSLAQNYALGALSNGNADIHRLGLADLFMFAYSAEQVGAPKPHSALFEKALEHTQVDPRQMIYVGDDPQLDVDAANRLGIHTIWLDHGAKPKGQSEPSAVIKNIKDLPAAVALVQSEAR
ncbi:MAG: HAD family hydrolase [Pseudomonadales bacterium]